MTKKKVQTAEQENQEIALALDADESASVSSQVASDSLRSDIANAGAHADALESQLDASADDSEEVLESGLIIAGEPSADDEVAIAPPDLSQLSHAEAKEMADRIMAEIDDNHTGIPFLPLNMGKFTVWAFENAYQPPDVEGEQPQPCVIITLASPDDPRGTPYILSRDRALKFASQLKKVANTGPSMQQRAAQSGIAVPPANTESGLIIPGR